MLKSSLNWERLSNVDWFVYKTSCHDWYLVAVDSRSLSLTSTSSNHFNMSVILASPLKKISSVASFAQSSISLFSLGISSSNVHLKISRLDSYAFSTYMTIFARAEILWITSVKLSQSSFFILILKSVIVFMY